MFLSSPYLVVHGQLTNEVQNGVSIARTYDSLNRPTGYSLNPVNPVNPVKTSPYSTLPLRNGCLTPWPFVRTRCGKLRFCRRSARSLPLLGEWSLGGREILATKNTEAHKEGAQNAPIGVQWLHD